MKLKNIGTVMISCATAFLLASCGTTKCEQAGQYTLGGKLYTSAWIQRSAEYKALCLQAYNIATERIDNLTSKPHSKPLAIVTDIDETIVDNSPNCVHNAIKGEDYSSQSWHEWCAKGEAKPLEGAIAFFNHAAQKGVTVFYISNRDHKDRQGTLKNLQKLGFPFADEEHLVTRDNTSDKQPRRDMVLKNYDIVMLLGDNLGDFESVFDSANENVRNEAVKKFANQFGNKFIVLPNPNYGTWEKAMNGGYPSLKERDQKLFKELTTY
ncbi:5'-nucleotidase, lipoprotein e(P4) family [Falsiporphyromonas endometrii]|uniref:5'-nucleotidase, lipoprotein e(P4) family n=1 Tax=Falsiporphyromonas endometrii TaxID=1387297 RepID=A0ABV9K8N9_9PORP